MMQPLRRFFRSAPSFTSRFRTRLTKQTPGLLLSMMAGTAALSAQTALADTTSPTQGATLTNTAPQHERQGGSFGVGILLGNVNGVSLKVWDGRAHGLQARVGSSGLNSFDISANYAYHFRPVDVPDGSYSLPFYVGAGGMFRASGGPSLSLTGGFQVVGGMSIMVPELPVEVFMEVRPQVVLYTPPAGAEAQVWLGAGIEGGMGVHYYF